MEGRNEEEERKKRLNKGGRTWCKRKIGYNKDRKRRKALKE